MTPQTAARPSTSTARADSHGARGPGNEGRARTASEPPRPSDLRTGSTQRFTGSEAERRYQKRWRHDAMHGIRQTVPAGPVRDHVLALRDGGMTLRSIAGTAGFSNSGLSQVIHPDRRTVKRSTAAKLMAVKLQIATVTTGQGAEPFVPKLGAIRRVQALLALGWRYEDIRAAGGPRQPHLVVSQKGQWITRSTYDAVATAYRALCDRQGPSKRTRTNAAKRGYLTPIHWDNIDLDDAPEQDTADSAESFVDPVVVQRILDGDRIPATPLEREAVVARWLAAGRPLRQLELQMGWKVDRYYTPAGRVA